MAEQCARLFEELGGVIHYNSEVEQINVQDGKVVGISLNGEQINTEYVFVMQTFLCNENLSVR